MTSPEASIFEGMRAFRESENPALLGSDACSYRELLAAAEAFAAYLVNKADGRAFALACALPHGREFVTALVAARFSGGIFVPINHRAPAAERDRILADSGSRFILLPDEASPPPSCSAIGAPFPGLLLWHVEGASERHYEPGDALVIYTTGSTGPAKGVILSDHAVSANVRAVVDYLSLTSNDRIVVFTPPSWAYAINQTLTHLAVGAAILPWREGLLNPVALIEAVNDIGATGLQANPSIFQALLRFTGVSPTLGALRYAGSAGQPLSTSLLRDLRALCPNARIVNMYGCTENAPRVSYKWLPDGIDEDRRSWPVGKPVAGTEIAILDEEGNVLPDGATGEVALRGTSLMRGYVGLPEATGERKRGAWFLTRDLGFIDENGDLVLAGRADNVILVGHEKVSPEEVEALLLDVAGIDDAAVGPADDESLFEIPVALIVTSAALADIERAARKRLSAELTRAKVPRRFIAVEAIPRTPYGKVDRVALRNKIREALSGT